ncbi:PP2C family protein-serine/threonine phosphatase, partial [Bacteroidota bacterium]
KIFSIILLYGVPGAFMSMLGIAFLNEIVNKCDNIKASDLLNELRNLVITSLRQTTEIAQGSKDGMDLALSIIDKDKNEVQFAGAFNPLYLIRNNEIIIHKGDKMPIAIHRKVDVSFTNNIVKIKKNDVLYMFSDGYIDQFGGPDDRKFLGNQFRELLVNINQKPLPEQKEILDKTIIDWIGQGSQLDDILVFGIRI